MSNAASYETHRLLENDQEDVSRSFGSGLNGIPMPDVEEISLQSSELGEFGEVYLNELDNPELRTPDPIDKRLEVSQQAFTASIHKLAIVPLESEPYLDPPQQVATGEPLENHEDKGVLRCTLSAEQSNLLNFKAISDAFAPVESNLRVIPEVADCIRWLKQPLYNATMDDGRLFITAKHPSLKLISALIDFGQYIESTRDPAFMRLLGLVQQAAKFHARDFQQYARLIGQVEQAIAEAAQPKQQIVSWVFSRSERILPNRQPALKNIEFNRRMLRYELAVHRLMRAIWPLVLTKLEKQVGRESEAWQSAFFVYGNLLRSTQVASRTVAKYQLIDSLPETIEQLLKVFNLIHLKEIIREEIIGRLMQVHLAIVRGRDGTNIREHQMDAAYAFRCLKGNVFDEKEYLRMFNAEGRLSAPYFEKLIKRVRSQDSRITALEEYTIERYRSVVSTEPIVEKSMPKIVQTEIGLLIKRTMSFLIDPYSYTMPAARGAH